MNNLNILELVKKAIKRAFLSRRLEVQYDEVTKMILHDDAKVKIKEEKDISESKLLDYLVNKCTVYLELPSRETELNEYLTEEEDNLLEDLFPEEMIRDHNELKFDNEEDVDFDPDSKIRISEDFETKLDEYLTLIDGILPKYAFIHYIDSAFITTEGKFYSDIDPKIMGILNAFTPFGYLIQVRKAIAQIIMNKNNDDQRKWSDHQVKEMFTDYIS